MRSIYGVSNTLSRKGVCIRVVLLIEIINSVGGKNIHNMYVYPGYIYLLFFVIVYGNYSLKHISGKVYLPCTM